MSFHKQRVLLWSGDNSGANSYANITVSFNQPLANVVYAEWYSCSIPGYCFRVSEFHSSGQTSTRTSGATSYWRFINSTNNPTDIPSKIEDAMWAPMTFTSLHVNVFNPDGSTPTLSSNWCLEIDLWCTNA